MNIEQIKNILDSLHKFEEGIVLQSQIANMTVGVKENHLIEQDNLIIIDLFRVQIISGVQYIK